jgi:type II secretory pathway pseudopilin PulG
MNTTQSRIVSRLVLDASDSILLTNLLEIDQGIKLVEKYPTLFSYQNNGWREVILFTSSKERAKHLLETIGRPISNSGFTLIEAMIGMGLICMASLAFAQVVVNMGLSNNYNDFRQSTTSLASSLTGNLSSPANCLQGFTGVSFIPNGNSVPISFVTPNRTIQAGISIPGYSLSVAGLNYTNYKLVQTNADGSLTYFGDLALSTKSSKPVLGPGMLTVVVNSIYLTTSGGVISQCGNSLPVSSPSPSPTPTPVPTASPVASPVATPINDPCNR